MIKVLMTILAIVAMLVIGGDYAAAEGAWCFREPGRRRPQLRFP